MLKNEELTASLLPNIDEVNFKPIARAYLNIIILSSIMRYFFVLCLIILVKRYLNIELIEIYFTNIIVIFLVSVILHFTLLIIGFSKRKYALRTYDISYRRGILFSSLSTVPLSRIQHLDITQGILSRKLALANLKLYTAGDNGSDMVIKGLLLEDAEKIRAYITAQINERI